MLRTQADETIEHNSGYSRYSYTHFYPLESSCIERCKTGEMNANFVTTLMDRLGFLKKDLDYHLIRASMVIIYFFFGYQKWFDYEAQGLIPFFTHGPLIFWMYPVFGIRGSSFFLGVSEWLFGVLLFAGFWNKKLGILGGLGSVATFIATITIIPFMPGGWAPSAGGFPAMAIGNLPFLMKDVVREIHKEHLELL